MQTKLGGKVNILCERLADVWHGRSEPPQNGQKQQGGGVVRVSQPLAGQHQPSQADYMDNSQLLPTNRQLTSMPAQQVAPQQSPDFNNMYQGDNTPLVDAQAPMAANEAMSGMFGGSTW